MELTLNVNDKVKLYSKTFFSSYHHSIVSLLYQPIMGIEATSLYYTLWDLFGMEKGELTLSHRQILTFFNWDIKRFLAIRQRLESIGLINVYYHNLEGYYLYELKQPLTSKQYFCDSNLNVHLLYQVGDNMYEYLERKFMIKSVDKSLMNISKSFEDTFQNINDVKEITPNSEYLSNTFNNFYLPLNYEFDFELFLILLNKSFIPKELITDIIKEQIIKEATLYNFDPQMMATILLDCVKDKQIDSELLHETARRYYKNLKTSSSVLDIKPTMTEKQFYEHVNKKVLSAKEKALKYYKTKTPLEWLRELQNDTEVPASFLDVVKNLIDEYRLPSEVINVLVEFVRVRSDGRLPLEYARAVASSWVFKKINTAEAAMEEVDRIKTKEKEYVKRGEVAPTYRKAARVVETPLWMKDEKVESIDEDVNIEELKELLGSLK